MNMDKLVGMLTNNISHTEKWKSAVGLKTKEKQALGEYYEVWTDICYALHQRYI